MHAVYDRQRICVNLFLIASVCISCYNTHCTIPYAIMHAKGVFMQPIYFAPMEGVTDAVYRRVHHAHFGGVDKYFIPFISPTQNLVLTPRERNNVSPDVNAGMRVVPQVLTKKADHFLWAAQLLHDMGYEEINLNIGCPSGTVTAKGKGAGMLLQRVLGRYFGL